MKKSLTQKLAVILLSTLSSAFFSLAQLPVAHAGGCDTSDPAKLEESIKTMSIEDLKSCRTTVVNALDTIKQTAEEGSAEDYGKGLKKYAQLQEISFDIDNKIIALNVSSPIDKYIETELNVTDLSEKDNQCIPKDSQLKITTIIEEPLDIEIPESQKDNIKNCVRNTFCVKRATESKTECISYVNKEGFCSKQASSYVSGNSKEASLNCSPVQMFLSTSGTDMLFIYISAIYQWAAGILGVIAVLIIVISGIQISAAGGDQTTVTNAKNRIVQSLGGLVILFLSAIILYTINPTFFTK
jgi:hypothetical protein